jgi:hypothetical protein
MVELSAVSHHFKLSSFSTTDRDGWYWNFHGFQLNSGFTDRRNSYKESSKAGRIILAKGSEPNISDARKNKEKIV